MGKFLKTPDVAETVLDWGRQRWLSNPQVTGAEQLAVVEVSIEPGQGHNFHKHEDQEEVLYVVSGSVEQWIGDEKQILGPGDAAHLPANVVHASFNVGDSPAKIIAIIGPCVGDEGYEVVELGDEAPWNALRLNQCL